MGVENNKMNENMQDVVIFMSAYKIDDYKKNIFSYHKKMDFKKLLTDYHILSFATDNTLLTPKGKLKYFANYNSENTVSTFNFEVCDVTEKKEDYEEEINNSGFLVKLTHSISVLLDKRKFKIPFFVNLESFYVDIASEKLCPPSKNGHKNASKNEMNRSISLIYESRPHLFHGLLDNEPLSA